MAFLVISLRRRSKNRRHAKKILDELKKELKEGNDS